MPRHIDFRNYRDIPALGIIHDVGVVGLSVITALAAADFEGIAVFLASRASAYITGQLICVDGGFSAT